jgi:SPOR domain
LQRARYTVTSRTIDDAHRPRIMRSAAAAPALRAPPAPVIGRRRRRHRRPKLGLVLGAALAGWATVLPVSTPQWVLIASSSAPGSAPLSTGSVPLADADGVVVPVPAEASAAAPDQTPGSIAAASTATPSRALGAPVVMTTAAEMPATGTSLPPAAGLEAATAAEPPKPRLEDSERPRVEGPPVRLQRSPSLAVARTVQHVSPRHRQIVVQLSSYNDETRARQAAEKLHRSLQKILKEAHVRTEKAEVHGRRVWRVVAGPVTNRERGNELCEAVHRAGQSCVVTLL